MTKVQVVINGQNNLLSKLKERVRRMFGGAPSPEVKVGYTAEYAIYVHENLEANHPNGGQAKYLEQPFREMRKELLTTIRNNVNRGRTLEQSLYLTGLQLQYASQGVVPVDKGNLRASAFTRIEH